MESASSARTDAAAGVPPRIDAIGWTRVARRLGALVAVLLPLLCLHLLWRTVRLPSPWPRLFLGWVARCAGARVARVGVPLKQDVFYVANHTSWIDIPAIGGASGSAFVSKAELRAAPVVGWLSTLNRTIFVSRDDRLGVAEQIDTLRNALAGNWSVTVFPEGTTGDGRALLPFRTSLLQVLDPPPPGVMVQPLWLDYGAIGPEIAWLGEETGQNNALRLLARKGSFRLRIAFLDPFSPADFAGRKAIASEAKRRIEIAAGLRGKGQAA